MTTALVVGAGLSGVACARVLRDGGVDVRVLDRGRRVGGRLGERVLDLPAGPHVVDTGAAYFTVSGEPAGTGDGHRADRGADQRSGDGAGGASAPGAAAEEGFASVVADWADRGLARPWTDTFALVGPDGVTGSTTGPQRWAAPGGLRSLVEDLARGLDVASSTTARSVSVVDGLPGVDGRAADVVVLAMPDPQAGRLLDVGAADGLAAARRVLTRPWNPVIAVWGAWSERWWPELDAAFVADDPVLTNVVDDGRRRGDGAAVLVTHVSGEVSAQHLQEPGAVVPLALEHLGRVLGVADVPEPLLSGAHRWSFASPEEPHEDPSWITGVAGGLLGLCGDGWGGKPRVQQAWTSGHDLGRALLGRL